jgi:serine protease AprX
LRSLLLFFLFLFQRAAAQEYKFLVRFTDKNQNGFSLSDPSAFLSDHSIQRRLKYHIAIDSTDLPVTAVYLDSLSTLPALRIRNKSRWFNQVLITVTDTNVLQQVRNFYFVLSAAPVNNRGIKKINEKIAVNERARFSCADQTTGTFHVNGLSAKVYGASYAQIHIHHGEYLHNLGFNGEGKTIAILDNGFNQYLSNPAFDSLRTAHKILGSYDFVNQKTSVNEESIHGENCFSILASNIPGTLIGTAPAAFYWLFKTEDDLSEYPVEEQNWVAAAEFADSVGADLISSSLGYSYFDDSTYDLSYTERNGHTSLISQAANLAVAKGMIVTASMGNSGSENSEKKYLSCPADADSVYAVGAVDHNNQIGDFSSWGPSASGQVKPDGVSVGEGTYLIGPDGNLYTGSGTSYSNPNVAGLITCLWQAFSEFNPHDILFAVRESADKFRNPDGRYGYGLPDFQKAYQGLLIKRLVINNQLTNDDWIRVFPVPFQHSIHVYVRPVVSGIASVELLDVSGKSIQTQNFFLDAGQNHLEELLIPGPLAKAVYFVRYMDGSRKKTIAILKN